MDHLSLPFMDRGKVDRWSGHRTVTTAITTTASGAVLSHSQSQCPMSNESPSAIAAAMVAASSSAASIAVPFLSINRMAYSLSSFNQQFRRLSQLSTPSRRRSQSRLRHHSHHDRDHQSAKSVGSVKSTSATGVLGRVRTWLRSPLPYLSDRCVQCSSGCPSIVSSLTFSAVCKRHFPVLEWASEYRRSDLMSDLLAGLTIAVFHVPECMGYSFLADVNPIYCLYSSLFPTLIYALMGTSQYVSVGTFAALSIMTGSAIKETQILVSRERRVADSALFLSERNSSMANLVLPSDHSTTTVPINSAKPEVYSNEQIAFVCTFVVGIYLLLFGILRLGFISVYMSEQFLNGFTCSVAYHVVASQLQHMLGLPRADTESGQFVLYHYLSHVYRHLTEINTMSLMISTLTACLILLSKRVLDPWLKTNRHLDTPFPIEFVVVIVGVALSWLLDLSTAFRVQVVGSIQTGLPEPVMPSVMGLFAHLWQPCISIAMVSYAITYSVGRTFLDQVYDSTQQQPSTTTQTQCQSPGEEKSPGKQGNHQQATRVDRRCPEINSSQELVALGCANVVSAIFLCIPSGASLSRSAIQFASGGRTQLVSLVNCVAIVVVLYVSSFFRTLPNPILATIISVALRDLLANVYQLKRYWEVSKVDASIWLVTFGCVVVFDINWGLYIGLLYSLLTLIYKSQLPPVYLLGAVGQVHELYSHDFFVPLDQYVNARELTGIKIFQFCGPLHFANVDFFMKQLESKLNISLKDLIKVKTTLIQLSSTIELFRVYDEIYEEDDEDDDFQLNHFPCSKNGPLCSTVSLSMLPMGSSAMPQYSDKRTIETLIGRYRRFLKRSLPTHIVIDCSMFSYIDTDGLKMIRRLVKEFDFLDVKVFLGGCPSHVGRLLEKFQLDESNESGQVIYISVPDAIEHARQEQELTRTRSVQIEQSPQNFHQVNNVEFSSEVHHSVSSLHYPPTTTVDQLSSLFSSSSSFSTSSSTENFDIQHLTIPSVIEMPHNDCQSLSIEDENDCEDANQQQVDLFKVDVEDIEAPSVAYCEVSDLTSTTGL